MVCRLGLLQRQVQDYEAQLAVLSKQTGESEVCADALNCTCTCASSQAHMLCAYMRC